MARRLAAEELRVRRDEEASGILDFALVFALRRRLQRRGGRLLAGDGPFAGVGLEKRLAVGSNCERLLTTDRFLGFCRWMQVGIGGLVFGRRLIESRFFEDLDFVLVMSRSQ